MEVIAVASTVCAICKGIMAWIDQQAEKEATITQISSTILQIYNILLPFSSANFQGTGELQLADSIRCIGDVLQRTREHLVVWNYKRSSKVIAFISPSALIKQLRDDERQLSNQLIVLLTSVAVVGYFRDHAKDKESSRALIEMPPHPADQLDQLKDPGARQFWQDYIGAKITFVPNDLFCSRLTMWWNGDLSQNICRRIVMRLDEYDSGGITPNNLARVLGAGDGTLKDFVGQYSRREKPVPLLDESLIRVVPGDALRTPLLVWIDDRAENNVYEVAEARRMGVFVVELSSTSVAKAWVEANSSEMLKYLTYSSIKDSIPLLIAFLRDNDDASRIRFISDNVRLESNPEAGTYLNPTAGESFLRYLRGRFFNAPVLIYTGLSIDSTRYVDAYEFAGSTTSFDVCLEYISSLAAGKRDDNSWRGYKTF